MKKQFIVSARKYRPESFDLVVGQPSITRTLKNAISGEHLAHAYLFCGPRGVGKTTCARIFAKTINCSSLTAEGEACNSCEACLTFRENRSFNIHELDAASNNHVEDIRNLIDQVRIPPQTGRYSVYIIDEVHMLSQAAFNAFLKTLEEPPAHAIFILATTEKHKIIPTILSRCQVFDFHRIQTRDIIAQLDRIATKESVSIESAALNIIAHKADGSMRDALSIFDQIVSFCGESVTYQQVIEHLNVLDYDYYFQLTDVFLSGNYRQALLIYHSIINEGFDPGNFISGLATHFRDVLVSKDPETIQLLEVGGEIASRYMKTAERCQAGFLYEALKILSECDLNFKQAKDPRLHVELALLKLARILNQKEDKPIVPKEETPVVKTTPSVSTDKKADLPPAKPVSVEKEPPSGVGSITRINEFLSRNAKNPEPSIDESDSGTLAEKKDLTSASLNKLWLEFAEQIKTDQPRLYHTLITQLPVLTDDGKIMLNLNNPLQEKAIRSIQHEISSFLQAKTGRKDFELITTVPDQPDGKKVYTQEEKYNYLKKKNPDLDLFRQTLNLDLE